ncbi:MFS transporter [Tamilnaduibacter salinus]|uniref:MFS transporter n=1 Tax=Tamilnaduibacter salinus TaxID=1484056 RepID=A0A2U1CYB3_9GAMM|nr:MFS transporter [Tamilnaduibacter salinus]PVY77476.1 MFS transporter [Tamilnaduibacter salinus]
MATRRQFQLLGQRRFLPYFLTQFSGAFNDNLFKNLLLLVITYRAGGLMGLSVDLVVNLAAFLFILPYFLFSGIAGQLADRFEQAVLIRRVKALEVGIMVVAATGLLMGWYEVLLLLLFLTGVQSTFFGPVKYAILPRVLAERELVGGNGLVGMGTFVAILLGTIAAGPIMVLPGALWIGAGAVLSVAVLGYLAARSIPATMPTGPPVREKLSLFRETLAILRLARERRIVLLGILAISWFWLLGAAYLTQFPNFARTVLNGDETVVSLLLVLFIIGISIGAMLCETLNRGAVSLRLVPFAALGLSAFGTDLYFAVPPVTSSPDWWVLLTDSRFYRLEADLLGIGLSGGLFIVPLYAFIQNETPPDRRARIIAALNVINALFMVISAMLGMVLLGIIGLSIPIFLLMLSLVSLPVTLGLLWRLHQHRRTLPDDPGEKLSKHR